MMSLMSHRYEGFFHTTGRAELFFQLWSVDRPKGTLLITHGLGEHSECYHSLAKDLQAEGWEVYGWDLKGHGRSEGKRGYIQHFFDYVEDLQDFTNYVLKHRSQSENPLILFGHSMGGLITTLLALEENRPSIQGLVLSAPLFGIAVEVPRLKDQVARLAYKWLPSLTLHNELRYSDLSRIESMVKSYSQDILRHDKISPGIYLGILEGIQRVSANSSHLDLPLLLQVPGHDKVVSSRASQEIFPCFPHKKNVLVLYPDSYHEIYNDLDREQAFADLRRFLNQFQGPP